ncbi:MAG: leucine-rich repeat protein [Clostridia bacterium]|nr:leucine-rich repeat protein [Clostridia bacterium]
MRKKLLISVLAVVCALCCSFGFAACDSFGAGTHTHDYKWVDNGDGTHKQHCAKDGCGAPDTNSESHVWGEDDKCEKCPAVRPPDGHTHNYQWIDNGDGTHKQHCQNDGCNAPDINSENHVWGADDKCGKCPAVKPSADHTHDYKWVNNWDGTHKQHCQNDGCDAPDISIGEHTYASTGLGSRCDKCGDFEAPEGHVHDYQWKDDRNSSTHSLYCQNEGCNYAHPSSSMEYHTWGANGICDKCRAVDVTVHKHNFLSDYYCDGDLYHLQNCDSCNAVTNSEHKFVDDVCSICSHKKSTISGLKYEENEDGQSYSVKLAKSWSGKYDENLTKIVIPCKHIGLPVTVISEEGFKDNKYITSVEIAGCCLYRQEHVIMSIGNRAFSGCSKLKNVVIPKTVENIGYAAFKDCTAMTDITVPYIGKKGVEIGDSGYVDYANFGYIFGADGYRGSSTYIPSTLKNIVVTGGTFIAPYAFSGCKGATNITLPDGITSIGEWAFPSSLASIDIPDSVTSIGANAFRSTKITSIALPDGVQSVEASTFQDCSELAEITIGSGITSIGTDAFKNCNKLKKVYYKGNLAGWCGGIDGLDGLMDTYPALYIDNKLLSGEITIPDSVNSIVNSAFRGCSEITKINIHAGVNSIGNNAFGWCSKLKSITVDANNEAYASQDGILYNKAKTSCIHIPSALAGEITVPYGITTIDLSGTKITAVNLPDSITNVNFSRCTELTSVTIPDSVKIIGFNAFNECTSLVSIIIPEGVTRIEDGAFWGCTSLKNITIPDSVTSIGSDAFYDTAWYNSQHNGVVYAGKVAYKYKGSIAAGTYASVTLKEGTKGIADRAFADLTGLGSITISDSVEYIGSMAFASCDKLNIITYKGTKAQWEEISKSNVWDVGMPAYFISCSDGHINNN